MQVIYVFLCNETFGTSTSKQDRKVIRWDRRSEYNTNTQILKYHFLAQSVQKALKHTAFLHCLIQITVRKSHQ